MVITGESDTQIFVLGRLSDSSDTRLSVHSMFTAAHYYVSLGVEADPKGLYYNSILS